MTLKKTTAVLLIVGSWFSVAHALDAAPSDSAAEKQAIIPSNEKPAQTAVIAKVVASSKSREQVVAELVQARKDGSYVIVPEAYPEAFLDRASR